MRAADRESSGLPTDVLSAPSAFGRPPAYARLQELHFGDRSWENFEKLCMRLAALEGKPTHWQRYGTAGQAQQGIDIYARVGGVRPYHAYQCKRYAHLQPSHLRKAVEKFLDGTWKARCSRFVFCVADFIEPTKLAEEIEKQDGRLKAEGIDLLPWGAAQLAEKLKGRPAIVDDFFGREWVKAFCRSEAAEALGSRLDGAALETLRKKLGGFYRRIFTQHDPGVPGGSGVAAARKKSEAGSREGGVDRDDRSVMRRAVDFAIGRKVRLVVAERIDVAVVHFGSPERPAFRAVA